MTFPKNISQPVNYSALTKVGKSVLNYEKYDYYGGEDWPSFHLEALQAWAKAHRKSQDPAGSARAVAPTQAKLWDTPCVLRRRWPARRWRAAGGIDRGDREEGEKEEGSGEGTDPPIDEDAPSKCLMVLLPGHDSVSTRVIQIDENLPPRGRAGAEEGPFHTTDGPTSAPPRAFPSSSLPAQAEEGKGNTKTCWDAESLIARSRDFNLDLSPVVLMAGGDMIAPLLSSGVASYLEFRPLYALFIASPSASAIRPSWKGTHQSEASESASTGENSSGPGVSRSVAFHPVPCSKPDVFSSHLLPAKEKRQLMKFLQAVADWGFRAQSGKSAQHRNEVELGQARSLQRPQNKVSVELETDAYLQRPLRDFLEHSKMDEHLQWVVWHALALLLGPGEGGREGGDEGERQVTTEEGLRRIWGHLQGLGQYGKTAFLWPMYGGGDLTQAFSRMSSVWGGTYLLRDQPAQLAVHPETGNCLGVLDRKGAAIKCEHVVLGQGNMPAGWRGRRRRGGVDLRLGPEGGSGGRSLVRRVVLLDCAPAALSWKTGGMGGGPGDDQAEEGARTETGTCGGVMPPGTVPGCSGDHPGHSHPAVHFYCVDPAARCSPPGTFILYLATISSSRSSEGEGGNSDETSTAAARLLKAATCILIDSPGEHVLWAVTYEQPLGGLSYPEGKEACGEIPSGPPPPCASSPPSPSVAKNVLTVERIAPEFYLDSPLKQARHLFESICPGEAFLPAEVPEGVLPFDVATTDGGDDHEEALLEEAMTSLNLQKKTYPANEVTGTGRGHGLEHKKEERNT